MSNADLIRTLIEFIAVILVIYGLINEDKLIEFEDRIIRTVKIYRRLKNAECGKDVYKK